jgi:dihydrolipoamide dehydrogenase
MTEKYDLIIIGGGPGGYPAAIRGSQLGLSVALVEMDKPGGECANYGCIPTKALIHPIETYWKTRNYQFIKGDISIDKIGLFEWARKIATDVSKRVANLLKGYGVELYSGKAKMIDSLTVDIDNIGIIKGDNIIIATGTHPSSLPNIQFDGELIHDNRSILGLRDIPQSILIIGGGYIGVEYANIMAKLGIEVYLIELLPRLLPGMDKDFSRIIERRLKKLGVKIYTSSRVEDLTKKENYIEAKITGNILIETSLALLAVGRKPNTSNLGLENAGVKIDDNGYISVDNTMKTSKKNIYASGDVTGDPLLAHKAFLQGITAAENAAGLNSVYNPNAVPAVIYTEPELASIGYTVDRAIKAGYKPREIKYPIGGLAKAVIEQSTLGFVKIVYDEYSKKVLGIHIASPHASELSSEAALAIEMGASLDDITLTMHPHPTISESIKEAAELALERPIHYILRSKKP